jgi:hypothetical protein
MQQRMSIPQMKSSVVNNIRNKSKKKPARPRKTKVGHQQGKVDANCAQQV